MAGALDVIGKRLKEALRDLRGYRLAGLRSASPRFQDEPSDPRLNVVIPSIHSRDAFGGLSTAIRFAKAMEPHFPRIRFLVLNDAESSFEQTRWQGWEAGAQAALAKKSICYVSSKDFVLDVGVNDRFVTTYFHTALYVKTIAEPFSEQYKREFPLSVYLIQDFEPGFFPWGSDYMLAKSTYTQKYPIAAVFNTMLLQDFFKQKGYMFAHTFAFEPKLNPFLAKQQARVGETKKQKELLVYGRPGTSRNAFEMAVEALRIWGKNYPTAGEWRLVSLGRRHRSIPIASNLKLVSFGKVSIEEYADYLLRSAVGLSLMISPHPSYPPLEMAAFGVRVVTNAFANKNSKTLSVRSPLITCLDEVDPNSIAKAIAKQCNDFETNGFDFSQKVTDPFLGRNDEFPFAGELATLLMK